MQTLVELLLELQQLIARGEPGMLAQIAQRFSDPRAPAELQVGRHYVARALAGTIAHQLAGIDPAQRKAALRAVRQVFPRSDAARVLRRVVNDGDPAVRRLARTTARKLGLFRVAPAGARTGDDHGTSWAYGVFPAERTRQSRVAPTRPRALERYQLPALASADDLARLVGVDEDELTRLMRPGAGPGAGYVEFEIAKAKGGTRRIAAPRWPLRRIQRQILDLILARLPVHDACHGFVAGRSTVTNAAPHQGAAVVLKLDLQDFFPTLHYRRVARLFRSLGYNAEVAGLLAGLTTYRPKLDGGTVVWPGRLPQGAPTSPALANLACRGLDHRLAKLAAGLGATYTRYADDLTFSFARAPEVDGISIGRFLWWIDTICMQEGFLERPDKRRVLRAKHQQRVTGIVVNAGVHLPRVDRRRFRAILHNCRAHGLASQARGHDDFAAYLAGYAAYAQMVEPALGRRWIAEVEALLAGAAGGTAGGAGGGAGG